MRSASPVFGIVAGEVSGDTLGAGLIRALRVHYPQARFVGIAGPQMLAEGAESLVPMERLSVMGLVEVLGRLRELFGVRDQLLARFAAERIDAFIGIDAPDFNLRLAARLKALGTPVIHYVSPSVWAWRQGRVKGIRAAVDLMLCLLPFEKAFYDAHDVPAVFVGHPLADAIPQVPDVLAARSALGESGITAPGQVGPRQAEPRRVALLPGSRRSEVASLLPLLLEAADALAVAHPGMRFLVPAINAERRAQIDALIAAHPGHAALDIAVYDDRVGPGVGRLVMAAADIVVLASGTATLEAMLLKQPMVVVYRLHWLTWLIARRLVRIPHVSLPNLLAGEALVPELLQQQATPANVAQVVSDWLAHPERVAHVQARFQRLHATLCHDASATGAAAIQAMLAARASASARAAGLPDDIGQGGS